MSPNTWSQNIDDMFTTTWSYRKEDAIEQAYPNTPFWFWLKEKGRIKEVRGYTRIEVPVEYGVNDTVTWMTKGGTVPLRENQLFTMTYEDWKYTAASVMRFGEDDRKNRGEARIIDYVERKLNAAERALRLDFERVAFANGAGANEPNGLQNLISATPTVGTLHNLSRATYPWWRNLQYTSNGVTSIYLVSDMRTMLNNMLVYTNNEISDMFLITTQDIYEAYEDELLGYKVTSNKAMDDASLDNFTYKGRPFIWANYCPSGTLYAMNPAYCYPIIDPDYFMDMTEWKPIPDQVNDRVAQILCVLQFICTRPISQSIMTGITRG